MSHEEDDLEGGGVIEIRGFVVHHFALFEPAHEGSGVILLDGGFLGRPIERIRSVLEKHGRDLKTDVRAILLSHGHIDHTLNIAALRREAGAPVYAPKLDADHISGRHGYQGMSRVCGLLESIARRLFRYEPPEVDHWFEPGEPLDLWGGLEVVGLPGHTAGHCGFFSEKRNAFFACDLFSNFHFFPKPPPAIFNSAGDQARLSLVKADDFCDESCAVYLNHGNARGPKSHRRDLARVAARYRKG